MADFSRFLTAAAANAVSNDAGDHNFAGHQLLPPPPSSSSMPPLLTPSQIQSSQVEYTGADVLSMHTCLPIIPFSLIQESSLRFPRRETVFHWFSLCEQPSGLLSPLALYMPPGGGGDSNLQPPSFDGTIRASRQPQTADITQTAVAPNPSAGGLALPPGESSIVISPDSKLMKKNTEVNQITIYTTEPGYRAGRLLAVCQH
jgi:hypothetical protein